MKKIALLALASLPLMAGFFPNTIQTSVTEVTHNSVSLKNALPLKGMSGVIIHHYANELNSVIARITQDTGYKANIKDRDIIHHDNLPGIKTPIVAGDKVIGGYLYDTVLLLAPDSQTYARITKNYDKKWVHPDLFAIFLEQVGDNVPTKENLSIFAKQQQIGLIFIVAKDKAKLLDPISGQIIAEQSMINQPEKGEAPFFMRFDEIESGMFTANNRQTYYNIMDSL